MSLPTWHEADLASLACEPGWHYDDSTALEKLATSLRRHGQLRAIVVRTDAEGRRLVVDGRQLLRAMLALGWTRGMVADIGLVDAEASQRLALDLELRFETDFAELAFAVAALLESGVSADSLAAASPFTSERLGYFRTLATFDWSQFSGAAEGQAALAWGEPEAAEPVAVPPAEVALASLPEAEAAPLPPPDAEELSLDDLPVIEPDLLLPEVAAPPQPDPMVDAMLAAMRTAIPSGEGAEGGPAAPGSKEKPRRRPEPPQRGLF